MDAAAVTFVVPGALAVAMAIALLSGGLHALRAIGQVVTGPSVFAPAAGRVGAPPAHAPGPARRGPNATVPPRRTTPVGGVAPAASAPAPGAPRPAPPPPDPLHAFGQALADQIGQAPGPVGPAGHDAVAAVFAAIPPPPAQPQTRLP
jgi:hypothetical protein